MTIKTDEYFGGCPECGKTDGYLNTGSAHWFVCDAHRVRWCIGSNLFSSWRDETEDEQRRAWERVDDYAEVKPVYPDLDVEAA
jgi:hypothetical protein